jgi:CO/xanthine dehydrogenase Mo-binding subunit
MVRVNRDGTVNVFTGTSDIGGGQKGTMAMIAAEELGVPLEAVFVTSADTEVTLDTGGSTGSRQTITGGTGARLAAADAKKQILEVAAKELKTKVENLDIKDGKVLLLDSGKAVPLPEVLDDPHPLWGGKVATSRACWLAFTLRHFAEVEVDIRNGVNNCSLRAGKAITGWVEPD